MYKHRILVEVAVEGDEVRGVSVQVVAEKQGDDPNEGMEKKAILERDVALLTTAITSLIHHGHQNGVKDSAEAMKEVIEQLNIGFTDSGAEVVSNDGYNEETKEEE